MFFCSSALSIPSINCTYLSDSPITEGCEEGDLKTEEDFASLIPPKQGTDLSDCQSPVQRELHSEGPDLR